MNTEGDALRYEASVDLSETNTARTQLVLMTGENMKVLEMGPATGYITKAMSERGCRVTGLEIDPKAAEVAGEFAERMIVGDIEAMDLAGEFGDERFDVVMYGDVLEHLVDPERALIETKKILAPGGRVVASIPNVAHASVRLSLLTGRFPYSSEGLLDRTHLRFFTRESIRALFAAAGYEVLEIRASTTGPFGTEMGLQSEDYPPSLVDAVMSLPDADTYQFIVDARPGATTGEEESPGRPISREELGPLWSGEEEMAARDATIGKLTEEVEWLRDVAARAEEEKGSAEKAKEAAEAELERVKGSAAYRFSRGVTRRLRKVVPRREAKGDETPELRASSPEYRAWIEESEPGPEELEEQRAAGERLAYRPTISVAIATGRIEEEPAATVASFEAQTYGQYELLVTPSFEGAVAKATGDYVAFVEGGDQLAPFALYEIASALDRDRELDVLYSDGDTIADGNERTDPRFTPGWSPELLLSADYISGVLVARRSLVEEVGGLDPAMGSERLWDLALRLGEKTDRIARIPAILLHRRRREAAREGRAVRAHLERTGAEASVEITEGGHQRIRWRLEDTPKVSIIIPTRHNRPMLQRCLDSIARADYPELETIVIESAPSEPDRESWYEALAASHPFEVLWWDGPFNYSAVNNWGAKHASGDVLLFLNDDTEALDGEWIAELAGWAVQPGIGAVGAQLLNEDGTIQHGGITVGLTGFAGQLFKFLRPGDTSLFGSTMWYRNVLAVTGACMAMRREVLEEIGGWAERYLLAGSDVELGLRLIRAGYRVVCTPFAHVRHAEQATRGDEIPEEDFETSFQDYREYLFSGDPYFNPNLSYGATIPRFATDGYDGIEVVSQVLGRDVSERA